MKAEGGREDRTTKENRKIPTVRELRLDITRTKLLY